MGNKLLISDANILIDMIVGDLLDEIFKLDYEFGLPDVLFEYELRENHADLPKKGLQVLVLRPANIVGFSWSVSVQGKARLAANGCSLCKRRNAALGADRPTLRACLWCPAAALQCLTRETAIAYALRLAAKHHRHAEPDNISWTEH